MVARADPRPAVLTGWLGETAPAAPARLFAAARVPTHETPDEAVRAFMHLAEHARNQRLLLQVPPSAGTRSPTAPRRERSIDGALAAGRDVLSDVEAKAVLTAYGVPVLAN